MLIVRSPCKEAAKTIEGVDTMREKNGHCSPLEGLLVPSASEEANLNRLPKVAIEMGILTAGGRTHCYG